MKNDGMDEMNIREYLENHKLLTDGAMRIVPAAGFPRLDARVLPLFNLAEAEPEPFLEILEGGLAAMIALVAP